MEDLIRTIVMAMVDFPDELSVKRIEGSKISIYEVNVAKADTGKIVGKHGRNIEAMRIIVNAAGQKDHRHCLIQILE